MDIIVNPPKDVVVVPQMSRSINQITIMTLTDTPSQKQVFAETMELGRILLWEGDSYDAIGQWTDDDVIARIKEIYSIA